MSKNKWIIDQAHSQVEFGVKHMMFTTVRGHFADFEGTIEFDRDNPRDASVEVKIDVASIDTGVSDRDKHLRSADFFEVEAYPTITFRSKRLSGEVREEGDFEIVGDLTIRGISKEVTLKASFDGTGTDPWGGTRAGFSASTKVDRRDFGLTWNQALETGGVLVGHDISISLLVQAVLQEQEEPALV